MEQVEELTATVRGLREDVGRLRRAFDRRTLAFIAVAVAVGIAIVVAVRVQAENERRLQQADRRWCPLISVLVPRPGDAPATTPRGRQVAERAADLASKFHCPPTGA